MSSAPNILNLALHHLSPHNRSPLASLKKLEQIHALLIVSGAVSRYNLTRILLHCLSIPFFPPPYALSIFAQIRPPDVFTYNALIRGFSSDPQKAVSLYSNMRREGVPPNKHTFPLLLKSKARIPFQIFGHAIQFGFGLDPFVRNSLLSSFASCGLVEDAHKLFDEMTDKDLVSYTALMDVYIKNKRATQALDLFLEMRRCGVCTDGVVVVSALCAAGMCGSVWLGKWIHGFYVESGRVVRDVYVGSALVDMYSKCGLCEDALKAFQDIPHKNVVSWGALLAGMVGGGVHPNEVTLLAVLSACAHGGLVNEGKGIFAEMERVYGVGPTAEHCSCMVDLLGRAGRLVEAVELIGGMQGTGPWSALLGACAVHRDYELGKVVGNHLMRVQPCQGGRYALLANLCSGSGDWKGAAGVRKKMREAGGGKARGCSWIEMGGIVREFYAFGESGEGNVHVYTIVHHLMEHMKQPPFIFEDDFFEI
ncbi:Pentatricopeptide repeat-containing protein [Striga hermonthica]|uniref:Pentatricopeptide repeat-containing protein n=1 Tax=Striga hermonthica TaxID=68872 RepID=A0A9N7N0Q3_STRHE|nr:Pentatricopeptide repeat-containing protein [Striga hermonthica]